MIEFERLTRLVTIPHLNEADLILSWRIYQMRRGLSTPEVTFKNTFRRRDSLRSGFRNIHTVSGFQDSTSIEEQGDSLFKKVRRFRSSPLRIAKGAAFSGGANLRHTA